jgi:hypothetical protein
MFENIESKSEQFAIYENKLKSFFRIIFGSIPK